jgi:hypothetical protein
MDLGRVPAPTLELIGNVALTLFLQVRCCLFDVHLSLVHKRRPDVDKGFSQKHLRPGLKSHSRIADLIEANDWGRQKRIGKSI